VEIAVLERRGAERSASARSAFSRISTSVSAGIRSSRRSGTPSRSQRSGARAEAS
jgi:hypothetical protein